MTARSLFNLILKIFGVFFIKDVLDALSKTVSVLVYFPQYSSRREAIYNLAATLPALILFFLFALVLLFGTDFLIRMLRLDRSFRQDIIPIGWHRSVALTIAVIAAGGWMAVSGLPELIRQMVYYYQERKIYLSMARPDVSYLAMSFVKVLIGLVLISYNRRIVSFIELKRRKRIAWYRQMRLPFPGRKKKIV